jgi:L-histidine N-alpha-methyltransferase
MGLDLQRPDVATASLPDAAAELRRALCGRPPSIPSRYFYDDRGSALFDEITRLPEYYPTRTEQALLERLAPGIVDTLRPAEVAELGAGTSRKTRILIDAAAQAGTLRSIRLLDVNAGVLEASRRRLERAWPGVAVHTVVGDFLQPGQLGRFPGRLLLFLGSTIGNLAPAEARTFLRRARSVLGPRDAFLVGFDLVKDTRVLEAAYNDGAGVTAAFNRNILASVNATFDGDFDPAAFDHVAFFDARNSWIEMRLRARHRVQVRLGALDLDLRLAEGDEIRTEISCKYTRATVARLLAGSGLRLERWDTDPEGLFALALLRPEAR